MAERKENSAAPTERLDRKAYKRRRSRIECFFRRLKDWRRVATRYERLARNHLAAVCLASIIAGVPKIPAARQPRPVHSLDRAGFFTADR